MNKKTIITVLLVLVAMAFSSCSSDEPHWADLEAHEKTEQLRRQYGPLIVCQSYVFAFACKNTKKNRKTRYFT